MSNQIYFYEINTSGYEDNYNLTYYSYNTYSQEEFEEVVFEVLNKVMNVIINNVPESLCYYNIYFQPDDLILSEYFKKFMGEKGLFPLSKKIDARMTFELDDRYINKHNDKLNNMFMNLDIDTNCFDNNCSRIEHELDEEKEYLKKNCGVTLILNNKKS